MSDPLSAKIQESATVFANICIAKEPLYCDRQARSKHTGIVTASLAASAKPEIIIIVGSGRCCLLKVLVLGVPESQNQSASSVIKDVFAFGPNLHNLFLVVASPYRLWL